MLSMRPIPLAIFTERGKVPIGVKFNRLVCSLMRSSHETATGKIQSVYPTFNSLVSSIANSVNPNSTSSGTSCARITRMSARVGSAVRDKRDGPMTMNAAMDDDLFVHLYRSLHSDKHTESLAVNSFSTLVLLN